MELLSVLGIAAAVITIHFLVGRIPQLQKQIAGQRAALDSSNADFEAVKALNVKSTDSITILTAELSAAKSNHADAIAVLKTALVRYAGIDDVEAEIARAQKRLDEVTRLTEAAATDGKQKNTMLDAAYQDALGRYNVLKQALSSLEERAEDISYGIYEPHFSFQSSEEYRRALTILRDNSRAMIKQGQATKCPVAWSVGGSAAKGAQMSKHVTKIMLRAFNGECDAALVSVNWSNITKMEARVRKAIDDINKLGESMQISISIEYLELRLNEIRLTNELEVKRYQEREEAKASREKLLDDQKAVKEIEEAQEEAEQQEDQYSVLLARARKEAAEATGTQLKELTEKVQEFEAKLDEARKKKERTIARAEQTKSGFVYVISNIGAFGEDVFKIGLTRRLEPMDRIAELSGASVPFPFDLHAMMFSLNAPELETSLHKHFDERKVNLANNRKEFYRNVELSEIKDYVAQMGLSAQFIDYPEAREYRETLAKRELQQLVVPEPKTEFAERLFQ